METGAPAQKVMGGTIGAAIASLLISLFGDAIPKDAHVPLVTIVTFALAYFMPPSQADKIIEK